MAAMDYAKYLRENPDIANHAAAQGLDATAFAKQHWEESGKAEVAAGLRSGSPEMSKAERDEKVEYVRNNPDLRENAEAHGYTADEAAEMGAWHFETYGKNESRMNEPGNVRLPSAATEVLSSKHFQGRTAEDVLGASVRAGDPSQLWQTRAGLGEEYGADWDLSTFNEKDWQMAADQYYGQGLLADEIYIRAPYGQLDRRNDPRFLQDRYEAAAIANDFPAEWVQGGQWSGPEEMAPYWNQLTNAVRDEFGLRAAQDLPEGEDAIIPNIAPGTYGNLLGGNLAQGTANIYSADPYTVPHMQTGGAWEGLGAEYQPGTVEGLGLLAGDPYTGYQPMDTGLLGQAPSYARTTGSWGTNPFQLGLAGSVDPSTDDTTTTNNAWTPQYGYRQNPGKTGADAWDWGYSDQSGNWVSASSAATKFDVK